MLDTLTATRLRTHLREIPELCCYAWLDLIPSTTVRYGSIHTARLHAPAPVNEAVLSLLGPGDYLDHDDPDQTGPMPASAMLSAWCEVVTGRPQSSISTACSKMLEHWIATTENRHCEQLAAEIDALHGRLQQLAASRPRRRACQLPCPRCHLLALVAVDGRDIECGNCDAVLRQAEYDARADAYADALGA